MKKAVLAAVVVALLLAFLPVAVMGMVNFKAPRWFEKTAEQMMAEVLAKEARVRELGLVAAHEKTPDAPVNPKAALATDNPYAMEIGSAHPATAYRKLMDLKDDPLARRTARHIAMSCVVFTPGMVDNAREWMAKAKGLAAEAKARQSAALEREAARCVAFTVADIRRENGIYQTELGDGPGLMQAAFQSPNAPEVLTRLRAMAELKDPTALVHAGRASGVRASYSQGIASSETIFRGDQISDAFRLAACNYGDDCGPASTAGTCITSGKCVNTLEEMILLDKPEADRAKILAARDIILAGIETKKWPAGWWEPPLTQAQQLERQAKTER